MAVSKYPKQGGGVEPPIPLTDLATIAAHTMLGNATGSTAVAVANTLATVRSELGTLELQARGANLTNADQTIQPITDKCGLYIQPGVLTANRILDVGSAGGGGLELLDILVLDVTGFTYTIRALGGAAQFVHTGNITGPMLYRLYNANGSAWAANSKFYARTPL